MTRAAYNQASPGTSPEEAKAHKRVGLTRRRVVEGRWSRLVIDMWLMVGLNHLAAEKWCGG